MTIFEALILGIIQGVAEFLPISSSAHLLLAGDFFGIEEPMLGFAILLHAGTLLPVCMIFRKDLLFMIKNPFSIMTRMLVLSTIPLVVVAVLFRDAIDLLFGSVFFIPLAFCITGILLLYSDKVKPGKKPEGKITALDAVIVGIAQAIALIPGLSRSGNTIAVALFCKIDRKTAAKFSFLMSIVANLGATVLETYLLFSGREVFGDIGIAPIVIGFLASAITGYIAITYMLALIQKSKLRMFSYYLFALSVVLIVVNFI